VIYLPAHENSSGYDDYNHNYNHTVLPWGIGVWKVVSLRLLNRTSALYGNVERFLLYFFRKFLGDPSWLKR